MDQRGCRGGRCARALALLSLLAVSGCAATEDVFIDPIASMRQEFLTEDLLLENVLGYDVGVISLSLVRLNDKPHLALLMRRGSGDLPIVAYLPTQTRPRDDGVLVGILGDDGRKLVFLVPNSLHGVEMEATSSLFSSVEVNLNFPDGKLERLSLDLDRSDQVVTAEIGWQRLGPPSFGSWGREPQNEQGPIVLTLQRTKAAQRAEVWLAHDPRAAAE